MAALALAVVVVVLAFTLPATSRALPEEHLQPRTSGIFWQTCPSAIAAAQTGNRTFECAKLKVPLDYTNTTSDEQLDLDLIRLPATIEPRLGNILVNYGGPGYDGLVSTAQLGPTLQELSGGQHDIVSWDPRGTGQTLPMKCWPNGTARALDVVILHEDLASATDVAFGRAWAEGQILATQCGLEQGRNLSLVGTAFVARDMFEIVDALGEGPKVKYWGISYGTVLGATALAMFPDRIERVVIDSVQNPIQYYNDFGDRELYTEMDTVWFEFLSACIDHPESCALAKHATSAEDLDTKLTEFFEEIRRYPIAAGKNIITYSYLKGAIYNALFSPSGYPGLAELIDVIYTKNDTILAAIPLGTTIEAEAATSDALAAIRCGDKRQRTDDPKPVLDELQLHYEVSQRFGDFPTGTMTACPHWPYEAAERYEGNFRVNTSFPALLAGNTWDHTTPLKSAHHLSSLLEGSVVLENRGWGHGVASSPGICLAQTLSAYFVNGTLPERGTKCEPDIQLFVQPQV